MRDRASVVLAASYLSEQDVVAARQVLGRISVRSPSSVTAALLLAESWRIQGDSQQAVQWYLRIAQQHPQNLEALSGMLSAGYALEQSGQPELALTLFRTAQQQAESAASALQQFSSQAPVSLSHLVDTDNGLGDDLRQQAGQRLYRDTRRQIRKMENVHRESQARKACLAALVSEYQRKLAAATRGLSNLNATLSQLKDSIDRREADIRRLKESLEGDNFDPQQTRLRQHLRKLTNLQLRDQAQYQALAQNRDKLPALVALTRQRLQLLINYYESAAAASGDALSDSISATLADLANDFRNTAAEAALQRASLQENLLGKNARRE